MSAVLKDESSFAALLGILEARQSCRAFLPQQVPDDTIRKIVSAAQNVPSWCNAQPWQLTITRGAETEAFRTRLLRAATTEADNWDVPAPGRYQGAYNERRRACGWQLYEAVGVIKGDRAGSAAQMLRNFRFFDAPHVAVVSTPKDLGVYGVLDCGAFVTSFMLAATALGIDSIAQAAIAGYSDQVRAHFDIPEDRNIICGISFGYGDKSNPVNQFRTQRATVDQVVDWR